MEPLALSPNPSPASGRGETTLSKKGTHHDAPHPPLPPLRNRRRRTGLDGRPCPPDPGRA
ncbi:protein of unknown function [Cupriavidus taiwanensis]|uniref:Uncharacterized protein n=1 Tax=Cupriavidus taiwanensis TaxID=164546 RepID=A0A375IFH1_9BURK|nr:hypothetical protein CBM2588_A40210 [Cupriavidus taiwanensis]SOY55197.1 hypothetical protein CBM2592_A70055 [Cupriavidus taiwanensis]SOY89224.1 hypothetical protein CBM2591_A70056 [Cupriavidus taiwanensis]SOZ24844.1 hypothetical protein CBM2608_A50188 [Cupriavidus taiwanensis]SOZ61456.1 hypothetical protein CBM2617_A40181 [Cupriavidus taiwanensis]